MEVEVEHQSKRQDEEICRQCLRRFVCEDSMEIHSEDDKVEICKEFEEFDWNMVFGRTEDEVIQLFTCTEEDGCVVNYGGAREYWCSNADQESVEMEDGKVKVYCSKLKRTIDVLEI